MRPSARGDVEPGSPSHVKSAVRTLQILEFFDQMREPATAAMLSRMLRYPQSSTSALLKSMVAMGYLEFDKRKRTYFPTSRVALIGSWLNPPLFAEGNLSGWSSPSSTGPGSSSCSRRATAISPSISM